MKISNGPEPEVVFPCTGYNESNVWAANHSQTTANTIEGSASNGFCGAYQRFTIVPTGTGRITMYNKVHDMPGLNTLGTWVTVEYRSSNDMMNYVTREVLLPANPGPAQTAVFFLKDAAGMDSYASTPNTRFEIRTLKMEKAIPQHELQIKAKYFWAADGGKLGVRSGDVKGGYEYLGSLIYQRIDESQTLFPGASPYREHNAWSTSSARYNTTTDMANGANGFSGAHRRFEDIPTDYDRISIYNRVAQNDGDFDTGYWVTVVYQMFEYYSTNRVLTANPGNARRETLFLSNSATLEGPVYSPDGLLEIRTLSVEKAGLSLESAAFVEGRIMNTQGTSAESTQHYFLTDHLGSPRVIASSKVDGNRQNMDYYPFSLQWTGANIQAADNCWLYNGKEKQDAAGTDFLDYGARMNDQTLAMWRSIDPLAEKYYGFSPYVNCANNPIVFIDPNGEGWRPTHQEDEEGNRLLTGYEWIASEYSYDLQGNLISGHSHQAIFFSDNGTFEAGSRYNLGSSTMTVYLSDGSTIIIDASSMPNNPNISATVPEGQYQAIVGIHNGSSSSYTALRMSDDGTYYGTIELGIPNPAYSDGRTTAQGINIHKAGLNNSTGTLTNPVSHGCMLVDINRWNEFIGHFNNDQQRDNTVNVTVSRSLNNPINVTMRPAYVKPYYLR